MPQEPMPHAAAPFADDLKHIAAIHLPAHVRKVVVADNKVHVLIPGLVIIAGVLVHGGQDGALLNLRQTDQGTGRGRVG